MAEKTSTSKYIEAIGRRKTSTARVRITKSTKSHFVVNGRDAKEYFKTEDQRRLILDPITKGISASGAKSEISHSPWTRSSPD